MTWWRRDSSLWVRTPIHRYLRRNLSDNETALRTRCFSKSQPHDIEHKEDGINRSPQLSEAERIQLRQYKKWQRRVEKDPYKALFGASESMLNGKGLKDWEWLSNYSPLWTIREMGVGENTDIKESSAQSASNRKGNQVPGKPRGPKSNEVYPKKVNITNDSAQNLSTLREESSSYGVDSPSDSRRVRAHEQPATDKAVEDTTSSKPEVEGKGCRTTIKPTQGPENVQQGNTSDRFYNHIDASDNAKSTRKTSFIDDFLADKSGTASPVSNENISGVLQTSLQQRESPDFVRRPRRRADFSVVDVSAKSSSTIDIENAKKDKSISGDVPTISTPNKTHPTVGKLPITVHTSQNPTSDPYPVDLGISKGESGPDQPRATRVIHRLLPKDDIDFLTADDIRASMGRVKNPQIDRTVTKEKLEAKYQETQKNNEMNPMLEWKVLNDQHVRRMERMMRESREEQEPLQQETSEAAEVTPKKETAVKEPEDNQKTFTEYPQNSVTETGLGSVMSWLRAGGGFIAHQFFQDPVDVLANQKRLEQGMSTDPFFQGIINGIEKSYRATSQVKLDLVQDIPAFKPLVERLTNNEKSVVRAAQIIRGIASVTNTMQDKNGEARVSVLKRGLIATEADFQAACKAIDHLDATKPVARAFERRFRVAADVMQKTAKLTRVMIFGLQSRLESLGELSPSLQSRNLAHRLLALQDTQLALMRLVARVMQVYRIDPTGQIEVLNQVRENATDNENAALGQSPPVETEEETRKREIKAAADAQLSDEVNNLKNAMQGLSDDGYTRISKPATRTHFDEPSPLANSLFRPFRSQLNSLGKETENETQTTAELRKKEEDRALVNEVKSIYEDTFGPITVHHRQVPDVEKEAVSESSKSSKQKSGKEAIDGDSAVDTPSKAPKLITVPKKTPTVQLLKEDEVSPTVSTPPQPSSVPAKQSPPPSKSEVDEPEPTTNPISPVAATPETPQPKQTEPAPNPPSAPTQPHTPTYHIYIYDPTTDEIIITPSPPQHSSPSHPDPSPAIPLHSALSALTHPSKFLPHLPKPEHYDIITARRNLLVLRSTPSAPSPASSEETMRIPATANTNANLTPSAPPTEPCDLDLDAAAPTDSNNTRFINPIDGTTRLSPTGFVGPSSLELEREFEERRRAAGEQQLQKQQQRDQRVRRSSNESVTARREEREAEERRKSGRRAVGGGGFASVVRTAIVAGAVCYVVGVAAELSKVGG